jgi:hypothetical protein
MLSNRATNAGLGLVVSIDRGLEHVDLVCNQSVAQILTDGLRDAKDIVLVGDGMNIDGGEYSLYSSIISWLSGSELFGS